MTEVLISSSALILAVCLLRFLLQNRISMKIRYGLWGLAALRPSYSWMYHAVTSANAWISGLPPIC